MKISLFNNVKSTTPSKAISIDDFLNGIIYGTWRQQVEAVRSITDKKTRQAAKMKLPCVTVSGTFLKRKQAKMIQHSGFICMDFDEDIGKEVLAADPYVYAVFLSASGTGLAALIKIKPDKHTESFNWLRNYFFSEYGKVADPAPSNPASLRYVSYDPDLHINPTAKIARYALPQKKYKNINTVATASQLERLAEDVYQSGIDFAPDYSDYLAVAFALADELGEKGRELFHKFCFNSSKYNSKQADRQYSYCLKSNKSTNKIRIGTLLYMAKNKGFEIYTKEEKEAMRIAAVSIKSSRSLDASLRAMREKGINEATATEIAQRVYSDPEGAKKIKTDDEDNIDSLITFIETNTNLWRNTITRRIYDGEKELDQARINGIYISAKQIFGKWVTKTDVESIIYSEKIKERNPIKEYFNEIRHLHNWGKSMDDLVATIEGANTHYVRKFLISVVAAAVNGEAVRNMVVLIGPQYTGKTWFVRNLWSEALKPYYSEDSLNRGKDSELLMTVKLCNLIDEMGGLMQSKHGEHLFKELSSKAVFSLREPYGKNIIDIPRLSVLIGTANHHGVISDVTGNTRIMPVTFLGYNQNKYNAIDRDQLWADALFAYENGEQWQMTQAEVEELKKISQDFKEESAEEELIDKYFEQGDTDFYTATDVKAYIEASSGIKNLSLRTIGILLKQRFKRAKNGGRYGYFLQEKSVAF